MTCIKDTSMDINRERRDGNSGRRKNKQNKDPAGSNDKRKPWTEVSK